MSTKVHGKRRLARWLRLAVPRAVVGCFRGSAAEAVHAEMVAQAVVPLVAIRLARP